MAYELTRSNGTTLLELNDGLVDSNTTSIKFVGKNVVNYGEIQNENFLNLLENFSNSSPPSSPIDGQLWFDSNAGFLRLKLYDGSLWNQIPTVITNTTASNQTLGDLWLNTDTSQLYVKSALGYVLIGPNSSAETAKKLENSIRINGFLFTGETDLYITATTPNFLKPGDYISGENFDGSNEKIWSVDVGNVELAEPFKVVARNSSGDITFNEGKGKATSSVYADLAEKYLTDLTYEVGTVVSIGGPLELTSCKVGDRAIGVISKNPGYKMNSELVNGQYVALKGRVPVKISGKIFKGDKLVAGPDGTAIKGTTDYFALALEDSNDNSMVEAIIL
jgi:hypothetical protein